ncbi:hypothetical protein K1T34_48730 [Amycolatopsis sp. DSM 110486]|nr:hypothetical protein K1T34_48730 [Amycolatopsis sp. DSM 110486]
MVAAHVLRDGARTAADRAGGPAGGKGSTLKRFSEHLNPRAVKIEALPKRTERGRAGGTSSGTWNC